MKHLTIILTFLMTLFAHANAGGFFNNRSDSNDLAKVQKNVCISGCNNNENKKLLAKG